MFYILKKIFYSLLTTHYSLLTTHYSLLTTHYSLQPSIWRSSLLILNITQYTGFNSDKEVP